MEYKLVDNGNSKKVIFDLTNEDTCMKRWEFELSHGENGVVINDSNIAFTGRGCKGHPKTISALIKNREISSIDTPLLVENTECGRNLSCGKALALCIEQINQSLL